MVELTDEVAAYFGQDQERERLGTAVPGLELLRALDLIDRFAPPAPADVLDVGGGPGRYAEILAGRGYRVHLLDPFEPHVRQATERAAGAFRAELGDARALPVPDGSADLVLLFGPLYHLTTLADRVRALAEARRVLRPGGVLLAQVIGRFAGVLDGLRRGHLGEPVYTESVERDLADGQHRNPAGHRHFFTTGYFHHPDDLVDEIREAGLALHSVRAVEGQGEQTADLPAVLADERRRAALLALLRRLEAEPTMIGAGSHLMGIAHR